MKIEFSNDLRDVVGDDFLSNLPDIDAASEDAVGWCPSFRIRRYGDLMLVHDRYLGNLDDYMARNFIVSAEEAATEIELSENRIEIVSSFEFPRLTDIRLVVERTLQSFPLIFKTLRSLEIGCDWVLWANIQYHLGDFDESFEEVMGVQVTEILNGEAGWWFMSDVSFAQKRDGAEQFLSRRIAPPIKRAPRSLQIVCHG